ncbi:hypothetical protein U91I_01731 [alpha proteobacterium U9-1i]|nr:hypothetical protein U91I_01731 [alpha proteobacterium U9-1i]
MRVQTIGWAIFAGAVACALPGAALAQTGSGSAQQARPAHPAPPAHPTRPPTPETPQTAPAPRVMVLPATRANPQRTVRLQGQELRLRDLAATLIIRPENRTDISISVVNRGPLPAPEVRSAGRRVTIDGKLRRQIESCRVDGGDFDATLARHGRLDSDRLPVIEVRMPQNVVVNGNGALRMHVGRAESATIRLEGCGEADLESVERSVGIAVHGDIGVRAYDVGEASVRVAGDGDVTLGVVREGLAVSIAGNGDLTAARVDGPTNIAVQGEGDVTIRGGRATVLSVVIAGAGDVTHNGSAETLDAVIVGGGDVRVRRVDGEISRRVFGSGDVVVGRARQTDEAQRN